MYWTLCLKLEEVMMSKERELLEVFLLLAVFAQSHPVGRVNRPSVWHSIKPLCILSSYCMQKCVQLASKWMSVCHVALDQISMERLVLEKCNQFSQFNGLTACLSGFKEKFKVCELNSYIVVFSKLRPVKMSTS